MSRRFLGAGGLLRDSDSRDAFQPPLEIALSVIGKPLAGQLLARYLFTYAASISESLTAAKCRVAAAASTTFTLKKNGTSIGTAIFASAGTTATVDLTSTSIAFAVGDVLTIEAPAVQDTSLEDLSLTVAGIRT